MIKKISSEGTINQIVVDGKLLDYEKIKKNKKKEMEEKDIKEEGKNINELN